VLVGLARSRSTRLSGLNSKGFLFVLLGLYSPWLVGTPFSLKRAKCYKTRSDVDDEGQVRSLNFIHNETWPTTSSWTYLQKW
jgi:hypothetical protein